MPFWGGDLGLRAPLRGVWDTPARWEAPLGAAYGVRGVFRVVEGL